KRSRALGGTAFGVAPSALLFAADASSVSPLGLEEFWITGVRVAPTEIAAERVAEGTMVGVVAGGQDELAQRPEVRLDRVRPRRVGRGEQQLDGVCLAPLAHDLAAVVVEVVEDHVDRLAI